MCLSRRLLVVCFAVAVTAGCGKNSQPTRDERPGPAPALEPSRLPTLKPGVNEQTATLPGGGTLRYTNSVPRGYDGKARVPLVVALHYGGDVTPFYGRGMIDGLVGPALKGLGAVIVAPDSLGGDWTTEENERAVVWLTRSVLKSYAIDPKRVLLTGYSMGGQGTWYLGSRHQDLFTAAIPAAGGPQGGTDWKVPVYVIHGKADEVLPLAATERHVEQLKAAGAKVELHVVPALTHYQTGRYAAPLREALPWLRKVWE